MANTPNIGNLERIACGAAGLALAALGLSRRSVLGGLVASGGAILAVRGLTGRCNVTEAMGATAQDADAAPWNRKIHVRESVTIQRPRSEIFSFWRNFENLPKFMQHLDEVLVLDNNRSKWTATAPAGRCVSWEAEIVNEQQDESISWRSLPGADVENEGSVRFEDAPGGRGTEIYVDLMYRPPAGLIGALVAKIFAEEPSGQIGDDLRRLRSLMEAGEVPTIEGQPSDRVRKSKKMVGELSSMKQQKSSNSGKAAVL